MIQTIARSLLLLGSIFFTANLHVNTNDTLLIIDHWTRRLDLTPGLGITYDEFPCTLTNTIRTYLPANKRTRSHFICPNKKVIDKTIAMMLNEYFPDGYISQSIETINHNADLFLSSSSWMILFLEKAFKSITAYRQARASNHADRRDSKGLIYIIVLPNITLLINERLQHCTTFVLESKKRKKDNYLCLFFSRKRNEKKVYTSFPLNRRNKTVINNMYAAYHNNQINVTYGNEGYDLPWFSDTHSYLGSLVDIHIPKTHFRKWRRSLFKKSSHKKTTKKRYVKNK